jgi:hypothetical protein
MSNLPNIPVSIANILIELTSPISAAEPGIERRLRPFFGKSAVPAEAGGQVLFFA